MTLRVFTFNCSSTFIFFAHKTFAFEASMINIFDSANTDSAIFLFKITLRNPYSTYVMNPNIMASGDV